MNKSITYSYIAGLIDGEGCIRINRQLPKTKNQNVRYKLEVGLHMTNSISIEFVNSFFPASSIRRYSSKKHPTHKDSYQWTIWNKSASALLKAIQPYVILKKPQLELALSFYNHLAKYASLRYQKGKVGTIPLPANIIKERNLFYLKMKILNKRGK